MSSFDPSIHNADSWLRTLWQGSTLLGVAMIGLVWASLGIYIDAERRAAERAAIQNSDNLARAFEGHLSRSLQDIDQSLKIMRRSYLLDPDGFDFRNWMSTSLFSDSQIFQFGVIGSDGFLKLSSAELHANRGIDFGDREHFLAQINAKNDELFIGKPVAGRMTGKSTIHLTRRIENADGSFGGVLVASVDPNYFARLYGSVNIGPGGYVNIVGTDGIVRVVGGASSGQLGADLSGSTLFRHHEKQLSGWFHSPGALSDDIPRFVTYRTIEGYPLIITIGVSAEETFAAVNGKQRAYQIIATILTLLIFVIVGFSVQGSATLERMAAQLTWKNLQFNAALENMPQGLCMFDRDRRLVVCNDRYIQMYGMPSESIKSGCSLKSILELRKAVGNFSRDVDSYIADLTAWMAEGKTVTVSRPLGDGRTFAVKNRPMKGGGWVATHEDITESKRAEWERDRAKRFLDTIVESVPMAILVREPREYRYILVNRIAEQLFGLSRDEMLGKTAYDIFPKARADLIAAHDAESMQTANVALTVADHTIQPRGGIERVVTTKRLTVRDQNDAPQWLIAVIEDVTEKKLAEAKIAHLAHHDSLTELPNRATFSERLEDALVAGGQGARIAVLFVDLDHFKHVNDTLGHLIGDELLKCVADRLRGCVREADTVARLGGDEFAIIQTAVEHPADVVSLAGRIHASVKAPYDLGGLNAVIDVSIGIALAPDDATEPAELMKRVDIAMHQAKADGRGTYRFFEPEMDARMKSRRKLEIDLRDAIVKGTLALFYQPIVGLQDNEIVGMEALLRWDHPDRGLIAPTEFVQVAEETGLIVPLGEWVLRQACSDAAKWPDGIKIAVNLSPAQFRSPNLVQVVINALAASGVSPRRLELEVTEALLLQDNERNVEVLRQLSELGIQIAMDDFGTGYSSLSYLQRFPFHKIKIDRSFVASLTDENPVAFAIVQAVATLATALRVTTTAEGVETQQQLDLVRAAGCATMQGYLFSPPRPIEEINEMLASRIGRAASAA